MQENPAGTGFGTISRFRRALGVLDYVTPWIRGDRDTLGIQKVNGSPESCELFGQIIEREMGV